MTPTTSRAAHLVTILAASLAVGAAPLLSDGGQEHITWAFGHAGREPSSGLVADNAGNLYGEALGGQGIVFELSPPVTKGGAWAETILHRFFGGYYGCSPGGGLIFDAAGNLYGTSQCGLAGGGGIVFRLSRPKSGGRWTETVLYAFKPRHRVTGDGGNPAGRLAFDAHGDLFGTTVVGGSRGSGTVYELTPPRRSAGLWTEHILRNFGGDERSADGYFPDHGVTVDATGALYGTTTYGGSPHTKCGGACGAVFRMTPPVAGGEWGFRVIHSFNGSDGEEPECDLMFDRAGNLYGTTEYASQGGDGLAFELSPIRGDGWHETVLYRFPQFAGDSAYPESGLAMDASGNLYGTGLGGLRGTGAVFRLTAPSAPSGVWTESVLHSFAGGADGSYPVGPLTFAPDGNLYGATARGGTGHCAGRDAFRGCGTVYAVTP
jgi:uncharacterized repeat protein (TIGR03803 family)